VKHLVIAETNRRHRHHLDTVWLANYLRLQFNMQQRETDS